MAEQNAVLWNGRNERSVISFLKKDGVKAVCFFQRSDILVDTEDPRIRFERISIGDWVVRSDDGTYFTRSDECLVMTESPS